MALLALPGCSPDSRPSVGDSEEGGLGPVQEEGAPCDLVVGCATGLFCDEGMCAPCGTGVPAPGKLCFDAPTFVAERSGRLKLAHLPTQDALLVDKREVHVRMLLRDDAGSLREQWFGAATERTQGLLLDLNGDGFDEFSYCNAYASPDCRVLSFESDVLVPFASVPVSGFELHGVPPHGDFPGRMFGPDYDRDLYKSWLLYPDGVVNGAPLPVFPTNPMLSGDFTADGVPGLAAPVGESLVVLDLEGTGVGYEVLATVPIPLDTTLLAVADLDADGRDEMLLATPDAELWIARLGMNDTLAVSEAISLTWPLDAVALGDLDGDGRVDIAARDATYPPARGEPSEFDRILVLAQIELGVFEQRYVSARVGVSSVAVFDVDLDGHQDLVLGGPGGIHQMLANP